MQFNKKNIQIKSIMIDKINEHSNVLKAVVKKKIGDGWTIKSIKRVWEPGGGSSLFILRRNNERYFLKVKHEDCIIESKIECEKEWPTESSLKNEFLFLSKLINIGPIVKFWEESNGFQFLALEYIEPFEKVITTLDANQCLVVWEKLKEKVRMLYDKGIVHTDLHEKNILLKGVEPYICDFEEARELYQAFPFEHSLDYIGKTTDGDVGRFPEAHGIEGYTCLDRLHKVICNYSEEIFFKHIKACNFGTDCDYNLDTLQEPDERIYQSVQFGKKMIVGQRSQDHYRLEIIRFIVKKVAKLNKKSITYLDVGSNMGVFCHVISKLPNIEHSIGLEASYDYVISARILAFWNNLNCIFHEVNCSEGNISEIVQDADVVSVLSVYHHFKSKDHFLYEIYKLNPSVIVFEFATQDRFYPERGGFSEEVDYINQFLGYENRDILGISPDYNRPLIVFHNNSLKLSTLKKRQLRGIYKQLPKTYYIKLRNNYKKIKRFIKRLCYTPSQKKVRLNDNVDNALRWIKNNTQNGIKVTNKDYIDYPEVTGYFIPTLIRWGEQDIARQYALWLLSIQHFNGSWFDAKGEAPYTFDTGQILKGLLNILPALPEAEQAIRRGCDWLLTQIKENGQMTTPSKQHWKLHGGKYVPEAIHLYCLEPMIKASQVLKDPIYQHAANKVIGYYLTKKELVAFNTLSHFHAYILEALVDLGFKDRVLDEMKNVEARMNKDGWIPAYDDVKWTCSTAMAQYAVIWYKIGQPEPANRVLRALSLLQEKSGGFKGGYKGSSVTYFPDKEISWAVKYFLDAVWWKIKTEFDRTVDIFPDSIDSSDGRYALIEDIYNNNHSIKTVLDAGCGKGRFIKLFKQRNPSSACHGIDISKEMLKYLPQNINGKIGSILHMPYEDNSFDLCFCVEALEHVVNICGALKELKRVTSLGGNLIIVDKNVKKMGDLQIAEWEKWFDENTVTNMLESLGMSVTVRQNISYNDNNFNDGLFIAWIAKKDTI